MALSSMVARLAHETFALGPPESVDDLVATATRLWTNALGLTAPVLTATEPQPATTAPRPPSNVPPVPPRPQEFS